VKLREFILIIVSVGLLLSTLYFSLRANNINKENEKIKNKFTIYKKNVLLEKEAEVKKLEALQKVKHEKEKQEQRKKLHLGVKLKVQNAYKLAQRLNKKYKKKSNKKYIIIEALNQSGVYVKNYAGNQVGDINTSYLIDGLRAIPLEEIQKVRRHKEGYIEVKSQNSNETEYIYVKNLEMNQLFIGANAIFR